MEAAVADPVAGASAASLSGYSERVADPAAGLFDADLLEGTGVDTLKALLE